MTNNIEKLWIENKLSLTELKNLSNDEIVETLSYLKYKITRTKNSTKKFNYHCLFSLIHAYVTMDIEEYKKFYNEVIGKILEKFNIGDRKKRMLKIDLANLAESHLDDVYIRVLFN